MSKLEDTKTPGGWCETEATFINQLREQVAKWISLSNINSHFTETSDSAGKAKIACFIFP